MSLLELKNISHNFDKKSLAQLSDISFTLDKGEIFSIIGPSGTGKSTLLNIILGRLNPDSGEAFYNEELLISHSYKNENFLSSLAYVPQVSTLDFKKTIFENISTPIQDDFDEVTVSNKVREMIEIFGLEYKDHKFPADLSAGQRQRVEFAKALVSGPEILLLDEPFSNLDQFLKDEVISEVFPIFKERKISVIFVTHNLDEAFSISDRMMVLAHGKIQQVGDPRTIYERPANVFTARFTGRVNLLASNVMSISEGVTHVKNTLGEFQVLGQDTFGKKFIYLATRPENVEVSKEGTISGRIKHIEYRGDTQCLHITTMDRNKFLVSRPGVEKYKVDQKIKFSLSAENSFFLPI